MLRCFIGRHELIVSDAFKWAVVVSCIPERFARFGWVGNILSSFVDEVREGR